MKFLHISDTHFGNLYKNLDFEVSKKLREDRIMRFRYVVDYAINNKIDFIVHSGDFFDTVKIDYKDYIYIEDELKKLLKNKIDFYFIRGNHDKKDGILFEELDNVYEFSNDEVTIYEKGDYAIHGISHKYNDIRNPIEMIHKIENKKNILLLHSNVDGSKNSNYMPTTLKELKSLDFDYIALGHIHKPTEFTNNIIYSGSLSPVSKKDLGSRGFYEVEILNTVVSKFIIINGIEFNREEITVNNVNELHEFLIEQNYNQILELYVDGYGSVDNIKKIDVYLDDVKNTNKFIDFSYFNNYKSYNKITHPIYNNVVSSLYKYDLLSNFDCNYLGDYNVFDDLKENKDEILKLVDDIFRR